MSGTPSQSQPPPAKDSIGSYFIEVWRHNSKTLALNPEMELEPDFEDEEGEESPTELDTVNSSAFVLVGPDKLSLSYPGVGRHDQDVGVVQANRPAPSKRLLYYFEIYVKSAGTYGRLSIGFAIQGYSFQGRQPGTDVSSIGYHGDDGLFHIGLEYGETFGPFGPFFTTGDTVGGGINYATQEFFFTKNGEIVGFPVSKHFNAPAFPTVGVHSQNEEVTVNFGKDPFVFDIKAYEAEQRAKQQLKIDNMFIPQDARLASYRIVRSYLQHYGYGEALKLFDIAGESNLPPIHVVPESGSNEEDGMYALDHRKTLRQLIMSGKIDETLSSIREWYPEIVQDDTSTICFLIHSQKFIELIRDGKLEEATEYDRIEFVRFKKLPVVDDLIKDCAALLAYEEPSTSSVGYLLRDTQRELVADAVNAMILSTNPTVKDSSIRKHSSLTRLMRQLTDCFLEKRSLKMAVKAKLFS